MINKIISKFKPKALDNFFAKLGFFKSKAADIAKHYVSGLMNGFKRFNLQALHLATEESSYSYRQLRYFIGDANWDENQLNEKRIQFMENDVRTKTKENGCISFDDTSVVKSGKHTDGVAKQYAPGAGQIANCKVVVTAHYSDDMKDFPLDAEGYYHGEESKLDLVCSLMDKAIERNLRFKWFNFDSWYCTDQVVKKAVELEKYFVSYLKSNRIVIWKNKRTSVSDLVKIVSAENQKDAVIDLGKIYIKSLGNYRLIVKNTTCFVTNNFVETPVAIIAAYSMRWNIDEFYHRAKDDLSFDQFQVRNGLTIMRHWMMVFLAYTFWMHCKLKGVFSKICQTAIGSLADFAKLMQNLSFVRMAKKSTNVILAELKLNSLN
ncbi:MAG TPA: transposase [Candidatus Pacearchaeota archaeon]|jgi:hypothetical protein|nr:transposase [Candidatus Pacearchaeota archaeon]